MEKPPPERMPDHLDPHRWADFIPDNLLIPEYIEDDRIEGYTRHAGRRALNVARSAFLAPLVTRPLGVSQIEWMSAHGLKYSDTGSDKAKALGL